ncbi:MAG: hypothetical protein ACRDPK_09090 [Carbonactinosporaceae bacterium]
MSDTPTFDELVRAWQSEFRHDPTAPFWTDPLVPQAPGVTEPTRTGLGGPLGWSLPAQRTAGPQYGWGA